MAVLAGGGPLHVRVSRTLRAEIMSDDCDPGQPLPSERDLAGRLSVSRATIRRALEELTDDGLVERSIDGRYSVAVAANRRSPIGEETDTLMSFSQLARSRGLVATADVLTCENSQASVDEAESLGIAPGAPLLRLERLRRLDGVAVAVEANLVPIAYLPDISTVDWSSESLYEQLERHGHVPVVADYSAEAIGADERMGRLLGVGVGDPLLATTTVSRDSRGRVLETGHQKYRGDRYRFRATLRRRTQHPDQDSRADSLGNGNRRAPIPSRLAERDDDGRRDTDLQSPVTPVGGGGKRR